MKPAANLFDREWKIKLILLVSSFIIYFTYFHAILLNMNSILSSITSDTIKNYFTYVYHIKNDATALHFSGMAFPYGEHVVYTDCQPILTFALRLLPFTHNYLIGILHALIFLSFIVSPVILYDLFRLFDLDRYFSFLASLAIGLLSPQFLKINAGHHGLAYAFIIPFSMLLLVRYFKNPGTKRLVYLFIYHCALFMLHPYHGFSVCVFTFMAMLCVQLSAHEKGKFLKGFLSNVFVSVVPAILFKLFMFFTDTHPQRTNEPYGLNMMIENIDSILAPVFGPMKGIMETFFNNRVNHYEGHTYLGAATILLTLILILLLPFTARKFSFRKETFAFLISSFVLLLVSFGLHFKLFGYFGLNTAFMNQFRATCRFAWFFYYALPVFLIVAFYNYLKPLTENGRLRAVFYSTPLIFFGMNLTEAHFMFKMDGHIFWKFRNFFNEKLLNEQEVKVLEYMKARKLQAIVPFPVFHSGSEMYDRQGYNYSMIPSMIYSSHSGLPILSVLMSRTSMIETENSLNLLNGYKKERPAADLLGDGDFMILQAEKNIMPDEERIMRETKIFNQNDTLQIGFISKADFLKRKIDKKIFDIKAGGAQLPDNNNVVYIPFENRKPFIETSMKNFERIFTLDSNIVQSGKYVVSLRYYYTLRNYHALACDMIVTETGNGNFIWKYIFPVRFLSGFYKGYAVMESGVEIDRSKKYEFFIAGREETTYRISDFMLRPSDETVLVISVGRDTAYNNFPD